MCMIARVNIIMNYELLENSLSGIYVYTQNPGATLLFRKPQAIMLSKVDDNITNAWCNA